MSTDKERMRVSQAVVDTIGALLRTHPGDCSDCTGDSACDNLLILEVAGGAAFLLLTAEKAVRDGS